ncbi:DUF6879 family protein [Streptomyces niveus]|uniref:DUF6879 family protein n=1 Tax=Streptomyces niveus TaxID=193462 RepID=UPI00386A6474
MNGNDWWLFDCKILAVAHFREDWRYEGSELTEDPEFVCVGETRADSRSVLGPRPPLRPVPEGLTGASVQPSSTST